MMRVVKALLGMGVVGLVGALMVPWPGAIAPADASWRGRVEVVDGDTVRIEGKRARLGGLDAFEARQTCEDAGGESYACGRKATALLASWVQGRRVSCVFKGRGRYGRAIVRCDAGDGDLSLKMIAAGWAVAAYGGPVERAYEVWARVDQAGAWSGSFERPAAWRAARR